jgi:hypothetical protein
MARTEIRKSVYAQIGDMGWHERAADGTWPDSFGRDAERYEACAIEAFGLYIDLLGDGRLELMGVYVDSAAAEAAREHYRATGYVP